MTQSTKLAQQQRADIRFQSQPPSTCPLQTKETFSLFQNHCHCCWWYYLKKYLGSPPTKFKIPALEFLLISSKNVKSKTWKSHTTVSGLKIFPAKRKEFNSSSISFSLLALAQPGQLLICQIIYNTWIICPTSKLF